MDVEAADGLCRVTSPLLADKIQQPALEADVVRNEDCTVDLAPATIADKAAGWAVLIIAGSALTALFTGLWIVPSGVELCLSKTLITCGVTVLCACVLYLRIFQLIGFEGFNFFNRVKFLAGAPRRAAHLFCTSHCIVFVGSNLRSMVLISIGVALWLVSHVLCTRVSVRYLKQENQEGEVNRSNQPDKQEYYFDAKQQRIRSCLMAIHSMYLMFYFCLCYHGFFLDLFRSTDQGFCSPKGILVTAFTALCYIENVTGPRVLNMLPLFKRWSLREDRALMLSAAGSISAAAFYALFVVLAIVWVLVVSPQVGNTTGIM